MQNTVAWYLISNHQGRPVALFSDSELADQFLRDYCPSGTLHKVDVSQCIARPIIETVNEYQPIPLGGKA